jgi:hypothetical protein
MESSHSIKSLEKTARIGAVRPEDEQAGSFAKNAQLGVETSGTSFL